LLLTIPAKWLASGTDDDDDDDGGDDDSANGAVSIYLSNLI